MSWNTVAIGDVCKVIAGQSPEGKYYNKDGSGLPFYQGKKDFGNVYINAPSVWTTEITKEAFKDDILMSVRAPVGPVNISTENICIGRGLAVIRASEKVDKSYLFNFLLSIEKNLTGNSGAVFNSINKGQIEKIQIPLPSISTQKKIVSKLDAIFIEIEKAIAATEVNIKNAEALFQCYLTEVFEVKAKDSEFCELNLLCNFLNGYAFKSTEAIESSNIQLLRMGNLYNDKLDLTRSPVFYPNNFASLYSKFLIEVGDILISLTGTVGKRDYGYAVRVEELPVNLLLNQRILRIYDIKKTVINSDYLFYFLHSNIFLDDLYKSANGTRQANLSSDYIKKNKIPLISIDKQNLVVNKLENIKNNCSLMKDSLVSKLENLAHLKQSVLQQAFNGKLVKG